ncbi:hypothetical protein MRBBS_0714 [Marinobacter sp. BSs20148]|nr:hypothetical protein MRBBS_0714 [Marinobacter sp. BSs20148]
MQNQLYRLQPAFVLRILTSDREQGKRHRASFTKTMPLSGKNLRHNP